MTTTSELSRFHQPGALRDGTPIVIRVIRADDRERIVGAFHKLDPQSIYTRFFGFKKDLSQTELDRLTGNDFEHFVGLVATLGSGADETIIAGASYVVVGADDGGKTAEIAFTVEEDYQGQGLAGKLMAAITGIARSRGIGSLEADVLAVNKPMLAVFERSGLPIKRRSDSGVIHLVMDLAPDAPAAPGTEAGQR